MLCRNIRVANNLSFLIIYTRFIKCTMWRGAQRGRRRRTKAKLGKYILRFGVFVRTIRNAFGVSVYCSQMTYGVSRVRERVRQGQRERVRLLVLVCRFQCFRVFVQRARLLVSGFWCLMVRLEFIIYVFVFQQNAGSGRARKWNDCRRAPKTGLVLPAFSDFEEFSQFFFLHLSLSHSAAIIWRQLFGKSFLMNSAEAQGTIRSEKKI